MHTSQTTYSHLNHQHPAPHHLSHYAWLHLLIISRPICTWKNKRQKKRGREKGKILVTMLRVYVCVCVYIIYICTCLLVSFKP